MIRTRVHIKEGAGRSKCGTCTYAQVMKLDNQQEVVRCNFMSEFIHSNVVECNRYSEEGTMSLFQMQQMAWVLEVKKGSEVGFVQPDSKKPYPPFR